MSGLVASYPDVGGFFCTRTVEGINWLRWQGLGVGHVHRPNRGGTSMTKIFAAVLLAALAISSSAEARGGCGIGWHRGFMGGCYRNEAVPVTTAPVVVAPATTVAPAGTVVVVPT